MKKLYASLVAIAAATMVTASAAIPELVKHDAKKQPISLNTKGKLPSQKALDRFASLASVENYNGPARAMQKVTAEDLNGKSYVNLTTGYFNDFQDGIGGSNVSFRIVNDELIAYNLCNLSAYVFEVPKGGPVATVEGNTVKIAFDQKIGTFTDASNNVYSVYFCGWEPAEEEGYINLTEGGEVTFTIDANGNMTADKRYTLYIENNGVAGVFSTSKLVIPNGTITCDYDESGENTVNEVYVEKQIDGDFPRLFVSNVHPWADYGVFFDLDEKDPYYAAAVEQIVGDASRDGYEPFYFCTAYWGDDEHTSVGAEKFVEATLSNDGQTLTFNNTWSCVSLSQTTNSLSWYGLNQPAVINFTLPEAGVEDIIGDVDNSNAPVEYFNLQGIRVNEPAAGSLVIRRQGTEVSKILVK